MPACTAHLGGLKPSLSCTVADLGGGNLGAKLQQRPKAKGLVRRRNTVQMVCIADPASRVGSPVTLSILEGGQGGSLCRGLAVISIPNGPPGRNRLPSHAVAEIGNLRATKPPALQRRWRSGARCQATIAHRGGAGVYVARVESAWLCFCNAVAAGEGLHLMLQCCDVGMFESDELN